MLGSQRKELVTNGPLCLLHFSQSQTKPFIFNLKTTKDPSLFNLTWSSYECLQTTYFTCFCEETPLRGFANKKPPAYHWWVKIPTSILNSIHFVNHQSLYSAWLWINILKWSLYLFSLDSRFWLIMKWWWRVSNIRNPFRAKFRRWGVLSLSWSWKLCRSSNQYLGQSELLFTNQQCVISNNAIQTVLLGSESIGTYIGNTIFN